MFNPNDSVTNGLGNDMNKFLLGLAVAIMLPASSAFAADLDVPPPMDDLRPATYDWSGPYIGIFGAAIAVDGTYDATCTAAVPCAVLTYTDIEHSGIGY